MDDAALLAALAGLFAHPGGPAGGAPTLAEDAADACATAGHEPAYEAVRAMLGLFPGLAPAPCAAPSP